MKKPPSFAVLHNMKKTLSLAVLSGALTFASAQAQVYTTLYDQDWGAGYGAATPPLAGTLQQIGWSTIGGQYTGMYTANGAMDVTTGVALSNRPCYFSSSIASAAAIIYTQTGDGSGTNNNVAFADIDPTTNPGLFFSVDSQVNQAVTFGQTNYWAVKVGGAWYFSVLGFTNNSPATGPIFALNTLLYNPAAGNWNTLTLSPADPPPNGGSIAIGGPAGALSGNIQGIGIVQVWAASISGNSPGYNYLNLRIQKPLAIPADPSAPVIKGYGYSQTNYAGAVVSFAVNAPIGTAPLTYSWTHDGGAPLTDGPTANGSTIFGAATNRITISNIVALDAGVYSVVVGNTSGSDNLANYVTNTLTVLPVGPELLYAERFPFVGPYPTATALSNVGWRVTSAATAIPNRLDNRNEVYAYEPVGRTMGFFTATNLDNGVSGLTFPPNGINPANSPFVSFRATYAAAQNAGNAAVYFAVQMVGGQWYVSTSANQLGGAPANFTEYGLQFSPVASGWNRLTTVNFNGNVVVGTPPASDLTGNITGVGLVFVFTAPALYLVNSVSLVTNTTPPVSPSFPSLPNVPYAQAVYAGGGATFSFTEAGTLPFTNHWDFNGGPAFLTDGITASGSIISGSGTTRITIQNASSADAGNYRGVVSNPGGTSYTDTGIYGAVPLTVLDPPLGLIYTESYPAYAATAGNQLLGLVGWTNQSDAPARMFKINAANVGTYAAFAYQAGTTNSLFYASTESDSGFSGLPFIAFNPANYPSGSLQFSAAFASGNANYTNVTASFAVRIGGNWYVNATPVIPYNGAVPLTATYTPYSQTMNFGAGQWYNVTLEGTAGVIVGAPTTQPLTGTITAAGLLFQHTFVVTVPPNFGGSMNWNSFAIQATGVSGDNLIGGLNINPGENGTVILTWVGNPAVKLVSTGSLIPPVVWADVPNTLGFHSKTLNATGEQQYFRLTGPSVP